MKQVIKDFGKGKEISIGFNNHAAKGSSSFGHHSANDIKTPTVMVRTDARVSHVEATISYLTDQLERLALVLQK